MDRILELCNKYWDGDSSVSTAILEESSRLSPEDYRRFLALDRDMFLSCFCGNCNKEKEDRYSYYCERCQKESEELGLRV